MIEESYVQLETLTTRGRSSICVPRLSGRQRASLVCGFHTDETKLQTPVVGCNYLLLIIQAALLTKAQFSYLNSSRSLCAAYSCRYMSLTAEVNSKY